VQEVWQFANVVDIKEILSL